MKIALAAVGFITNDTNHNFETIKKITREYHDKADLIVFGESFLQGFDCLSWNYSKDTETAVDRDSNLIREIRSLSEKYKLALSFGYFEKSENKIYSSQLSIGRNGDILNNYRRISIGWKEPFADSHYCEGDGFSQFTYLNKSFSVALCGDLWDEENCIKMHDLDSDIVLWPVYTDFNYQEWNEKLKYEYAEQAEKCADKVLYINSHCLDRSSECIARGGAALFNKGKIECEIPAGEEAVLIVEV